ncbi:MAG TPA: hypothetical protein VKC60_16850, partial [Opitutaceae bacterium]|nr:hypothetical protein [Opitutaceae bacterium]
MIAHRLRGLVNLHAVVVTVVASLVFLVYASLVPYVPRLDLSPDVRLSTYVACIVAGMVVSTRVLALNASRFHRLNWIDAARITSRQIIYMAMFIFAMMFAVKDRSISRIFVGSYLCICWAVLLFINQGLPRMLSRMVFQRQ